MRRYDEALAEVDRTIELEPTHAGAYFNRALILAHQGEDFDLVIVDCNRALARAPDYEQAHILKLRALERLGRHDEATKERLRWQVLEDAARVDA